MPHLKLNGDYSMKLSKAHLVAILCSLGFASGPVLASENVEIPENVRQQIETLIKLGAISIDPESNKPVINLDVLKQLTDEKRVDIQLVSDRVICGGG
jgi:hypothetical protein